MALAPQGIAALPAAQDMAGSNPLAQIPGLQPEVASVLAHYFQNRGVEMDKAVPAVQKMLSEGLKLIPHGNSVMGMQLLTKDSAKVHFFTMGTEQQLDKDIQTFAQQLQAAGIHTLYDTEVDPMAVKGLQMVGYKVGQSDKPEFKLKATL